MYEPNEYEGKELDLFANAHNWKRYFGQMLRKFIYGEVLEVGAGIGSTTLALYRSPELNWTCLEPDPRLALQMHELFSSYPREARPKVIIGSLADLAPNRTFDTILYVDVLEHIEDDSDELSRATNHLNPKGSLVILAPAHQFLYSPFDKSLGHVRRYNRKSLSAALSQIESKLETMFYLDSAGLLASAANRFLLSQDLPTVQQIKIWDSFLIPISRVLDILTGHHLGKTIVGVSRKQ
jgi:SAM-dependent methyltransferase